MNGLDELMKLADAYAEAFSGPYSIDYCAQTRSMLEAELEPIIADAQRYRSLQGKTDEQA